MVRGIELSAVGVWTVLLTNTPQFKERVATKHAEQERTVGSQCSPSLNQDTCAKTRSDEIWMFGLCVRPVLPKRSLIQCNPIEDKMQS